MDCNPNATSKTEPEKPIGKPMPKYWKSDVLKKGGEWLGDVREWIQCKVINGENVTWGSNEILGKVSEESYKAFTVREIEEIGSIAATAVYNEIGCGPGEVQQLRQKVKIAIALLERIKTRLETAKDHDKPDSIYGSVVWDLNRLNRE